MNVAKLFLSPGGRITRKEFWLGHAMILGGTIATGVVGGFLFGVLSTIPGLEVLRVWGPAIVGAGVGIVALGAELMLAVKRMHDRDASGLWVVGVVALAFITNLMIGGQRVYAGETPFTPVTVGLAVFTAIMGIWLVVELGFLRGSAGDNAYGASPADLPADEAPLVLTDAMIVRESRTA